MSENTTTKPTLEQRRANHAWKAIRALTANGGKNSEDAKTYAREAKKLPVRIMTSGLGQALAFLWAKQQKKDSLRHLMKDLTDWVIRERKLDAKSQDSLLESIIQGKAQFLRIATVETLAYLQWLNRFAEAEIDFDAQGDT